LEAQHLNFVLESTKKVEDNFKTAEVFWITELNKLILTQNLHTLKKTAISIVIQGFYKMGLLSGSNL
tara:strand:- start:278 stop:478 length:201 start_codon:yes stop_codon:yes gene_type:complete